MLPEVPDGTQPKDHVFTHLTFLGKAIAISGDLTIQDCVPTIRRNDDISRKVQAIVISWHQPAGALIRFSFLGGRVDIQSEFA